MGAPIVDDTLEYDFGEKEKQKEKEKKEEKSYTLDKIMWEMLKDKGEMRLG